MPATDGIPQSPLQIAIVGMGNVGTGVAKILIEQADRIAHRAGRPVVVKHAIVKDETKSRDIVLPPGVLSSDLSRVLNDPTVTVAVETIGGLHPAKETVLALLKAGKDVVTANKALLCEYGHELFGTARELGRTIAFEAAVAGGIPIIAAVGQSMAANQIIGIQAILNGTSNYILTEMQLYGRSYAAALKQAQDLGYAEADPSLDVNGTDAAQKLSILVQLAFGTKLAVADFPVVGIDAVDQTDIRCAEELGYTIKLLASAKLTGKHIELSVRPTLVKKDRPLSQIPGPFNAILLEGDMVGPVWYSGRGAGQLPTASAVTADIIDIAVGRAQLTFSRLDLWREKPAFTNLGLDDYTSRYFLRLKVEDKPRVMADITGILGKHGISLASVIQPETPEVDSAAANVPVVPLIIMTHRTTAGQLAAANRDFDKLPAIHQPRVCLAVAD